MASALQFETALKKIIADERDGQVADLADGGPTDYAAYREAVGFIRALDQFDEWCAEAAKDLDER